MRQGPHIHDNLLAFCVFIKELVVTLFYSDFFMVQKEIAVTTSTFCHTCVLSDNILCVLLTSCLSWAQLRITDQMHLTYTQYVQLLRQVHRRYLVN